MNILDKLHVNLAVIHIQCKLMDKLYIIIKEFCLKLVGIAIILSLACLFLAEDKLDFSDKIGLDIS